MLKGSLVPNITIFDEHGAVDNGKTRWHMEWMFSKGVDGLFLTGSYGSGPLMSNEERAAIFTLAREAAGVFRDRILLPHVGCIDTRSTVDLARAAEKAGAHAVGAVPPYYYKHSDETILEYYRAILAVVKIPVYAYNNPETSRYTFNLKTVRTLMEAGLAGLKDSPLSIGFISQLHYGAQDAGKAFQLILGTSTGWLPLYHMGVRAMIAGMNNWAPEIVTELVRSTFAGEWDRARKCYLVMMDLSGKLHFTDSTIASHMALHARGFDAGYPRRPMILPPVSDPKYAEIRTWLEGAFRELGLPLETGKALR
ncbi:MAG TPA: dihydrodipicolinate synthase family protein [Magnetospirillaceae bacterium]|nr:dihydrodipicolinate synthase family protein [Magnetospirillaceae bacterium]